MSAKQAPGTLPRLTFSSVVSLVRTSAAPGAAMGSKASGPDSGTNSSASQTRSNPQRSSSKTSRVGRRGGCARCGPGCTNLDIERAPWSLPLAIWGRLTGDNACSSSLWPTAAAARDHKGPHMPAGPGAGQREGGPDLSRAVLWPTATDAEASGAAAYDRTSGRHSGTTLTDAAVRQWPTPTANRYGTTNNGSPHDGRTAYATAGTPSLDTLIMREGRSDSGGVVLNPAWVESLMGYPPGWTDAGPPAAAKRSTAGNRPARSPASAARTGKRGSMG